MWPVKPIRLVTFLWCMVGLLMAVGPIGLGLGLGKLGYMCSHFLGAYVKKQPSTLSPPECMGLYRKGMHKFNIKLLLRWDGWIVTNLTMMPMYELIFLWCS